MAEEITFTTAAFGGFEKKQVLDYILQMHEEIDQDKSRHKKQLDDISIAFNELEGRASSAENISAQLNEQLTAAKTALQKEQIRNEQLNQKVQELEQKLSHSTQILDQRNRQLENLQNQAIQNSPQVQEQIQADNSAQIGRVMLDAHAKANRIVEQARIDADTILGEARRSLDSRLKQNDVYLEQYKQMKELETKQSVEAIKQTTYAQLNNAYIQIEDLLRSLITATDDTRSNFLLLGNQITSLQKSTSNNHSTSSNDNIVIPEPNYTPPSSDQNTVPNPPPISQQPSSTPAQQQTVGVSDKYSDLFDYQPMEIKKPHIDYKEEYPYNNDFPQNNFVQNQETSTPIPDTMPDLNLEISSTPQNESPSSNQFHSTVRYDDEISNNSPNTSSVDYGTENTRSTLHTETQNLHDDYLNDDYATDHSTTNIVDEETKIEFNFEASPYINDENLKINAEYNEEITFPSLHPINYDDEEETKK